MEALSKYFRYKVCMSFTVISACSIVNEAQSSDESVWPNFTVEANNFHYVLDFLVRPCVSAIFLCIVLLTDLFDYKFVFVIVNPYAIVALLGLSVVSEDFEAYLAYLELVEIAAVEGFEFAEMLVARTLLVDTLLPVRESDANTLECTIAVLLDFNQAEVLVFLPLHLDVGRALEVVVLAPVFDIKIAHDWQFIQRTSQWRSLRFCFCLGYNSGLWNFWIVHLRLNNLLSQLLYFVFQ